jgi:hypothetical protein
MNKFFKFHDLIVWEPAGDNPNVFIGESTIVFGSCQNTKKWTEITRVEFTAAALQAIEKLKAQGIDIGTEWLPKWEPKPGEVVCAWDDFDTNIFAVGVYSGQCTDEIGYKYSVNRMTWRYIAPFTGEIPEPFKTRWEAEGNANQ